MFFSPGRAWQGLTLSFCVRHQQCSALRWQSGCRRIGRKEKTTWCATNPLPELCVCVCKKHMAHHCKLCFLFLVCFCFSRFIALSPMSTCAFRWIWQLEGRVWYWSTRHTQRCGNAEKWAFGFPTILSRSAKRRQFETSYSRFHLMLWNSVQHELGSWPLADVCQRPEKLKQFERIWNIWNTCATSLRARDFWGTSTRRGVATCWRLERAFACLIRPSKSRCLKLKWIRLLCALKEAQSLAAGRSYSS